MTQEGLIAWVPCSNEFRSPWEETESSIYIYEASTCPLKVQSEDFLNSEMSDTMASQLVDNKCPLRRAIWP